MKLLLLSMFARPDILMEIISDIFYFIVCQSWIYSLPWWRRSTCIFSHHARASPHIFAVMVYTFLLPSNLKTHSILPIQLKRLSGWNFLWIFGLLALISVSFYWLPSRRQWLLYNLLGPSILGFENWEYGFEYRLACNIDSTFVF